MSGSGKLSENACVLNIFLFRADSHLASQAVDRKSLSFLVPTHRGEYDPKLNSDETASCSP